MLNKKMATIFVCLLLIITGSIQKAVPAEAQNGFVTITGSNLNVREGPGLSYSIVSKVNKGERFPIVKEQGDWIKIGLSAGRQGWVANWYTTKDSTDHSLATGGTTGTVTADSLRVRTGPGTSHPLAGSLTHGQKVAIKELSGNWVKISLSQLEGWVSKEYLSMSTTQQANSQSGKKEATVTAGLNVRTSPSVSSKYVGTLAKGSRVIVNSQANGWSQINYNGTNSWVSSQYLNFSNQTQNSSTASAKAVVTASSLYIRDQGNLNGKVVGQVVKGQTFNILAETNNWLKIEYENGKTGWAAGWFFDKSQTNGGISTSAVKNQTITILSDGTNIRNDAGVDGAVLQRATKGETYEVTNLNGDWYQIRLSGGKTGYVAGWIVSLNGSGTQIEKPDAGVHTKNKTIVIDPGHGGNDTGTIGARGTLEKDLNLKTAKLLYDKLRAAGANVNMTRTSDQYVTLASRVSASHYRNADAFISIHYDSISDKSVRGMTTYYYYGKGLATELHSGVINRTQLKNRDVRYGNYYVLRENKQSSALLELGYLSNPTEEMLVTTNQYQQTVANGLFEGLARYFKTN